VEAAAQARSPLSFTSCSLDCSANKPLSSARPALSALRPPHTLFPTSPNPTKASGLFWRVCARSFLFQPSPPSSPPISRWRLCHRQHGERGATAGLRRVHGQHGLGCQFVGPAGTATVATATAATTGPPESRVVFRSAECRRSPGPRAAKSLYRPAVSRLQFCVSNFPCATTKQLLMSALDELIPRMLEPHFR
jgi:hypothetical protein